MKWGRSIRARLLLGAAAVLVAFVAGAGLAVQRAHEDSVRSAHFARLQATVYLLLARAELDDDGVLVMPAELPEPRLSVPQSGLYAGIYNALSRQLWQSASTVASAQPPFRRELAPGEWRYEAVRTDAGAYLSASYGVKWANRRVEAPLVLSVLEDEAGFDREIAIFQRTLWSWLGGAGVLLLLAQTLLLEWALAPLARVASEIRRVESGEQTGIEGEYPAELAGLTENLNTLIRQERVRQTRYKEALGVLAHSLKTPLAVLRGALAEPAQLPAVVEDQVGRMDGIVQHQLGRAAAGGATRFAPPLPVGPVLARIQGALAKVHAEKGLAIDVDCPPDLAWRIDEGDLFEMMGNLMDNAAKWARRRVAVRAWREGASLRIRVQDDGPGFTDTESILQMHVRLDERVPGHGIGLAVVRDLVDSHHGKLTLTNGEGGGACVDVTLPTP
jgi:two-component system sensor histidine kinase PhoQ